MKFSTGTEQAMQRLRQAIDQLAEVGQDEHLLAEPLSTGDGNAVLVVDEDLALPYYGQSSEVDEQTVTVPTDSELLTREQLTGRYRNVVEYLLNPPPPWEQTGAPAWEYTTWQGR